MRPKRRPLRPCRQHPRRRSHCRYGDGHGRRAGPVCGGARRDVGLVIVLSSMLHGIGVGNMLPAWVPVVCVDINPAVVTKLADRGSSQTIGLVTDVGLVLAPAGEERLGRLAATPTHKTFTGRRGGRRNTPEDMNNWVAGLGFRLISQVPNVLHLPPVITIGASRNLLVSVAPLVCPPPPILVKVFGSGANHLIASPSGCRTPVSVHPNDLSDRWTGPAGATCTARSRCWCSPVRRAAGEGSDAPWRTSRRPSCASAPAG